MFYREYAVVFYLSQKGKFRFRLFSKYSHVDHPQYGAEYINKIEYYTTPHDTDRCRNINQWKYKIECYTAHHDTDKCRDINQHN